jgi:leucyl aminopeptidase
MIIKATAGAMEKIRTDGGVLLLFDDEKPGRAQERLDKALGGVISKIVKRGDFKAKPGAVRLLYAGNGIPVERLALAGLGRKSGFTLNRLRQAAGKAAATLRAAGAEDIVIALDGLGRGYEEIGQAAIEGSMLGLYRFLTYKTGDDNGKRKDVRKITLVTETGAAVKALEKGAKTGAAIAESATMARDMVNTPAADMTPAIIASKARELGRRYGFSVRVLERRDMEKLGMGGLLGVAAGSVQPPKFIIIEYRRGGKKPVIALVGKTITFDSGGISIKPPDNMDRMKDDMSGGAAVLGAIRAAAILKLPLNIVGLLPATENMPSGSALKPGDILRTLSGQTIEIINTDAEGRLVLSDALAYACRYKPSVIVDIATLTGASAIALGQEAIGMLGTDETFTRKVREAGNTTGERVWELPLWEEYYELIKSDIADMKNAGGRAGGVITAAALLSKFVQKYPWVHLDIASTAWTDKDRPYTPKGATGIGTRLLTQFLRDFEKEEGGKAGR